MTHTYTVTGMTCTGCQAKVQKMLSQIPGIQEAAIDLAKAEATLSMATHVPTEQLQAALKDYPKYQLSEQKASIPQPKYKEEKKRGGNKLKERTRRGDRTSSRETYNNYNN